MKIRKAAANDLEGMAHRAELLQADGATHIGYLGTDARSIAADLAGVDQWVERTAVAEVSGTIVGWLTAEFDEEMGRAWWWGPFCEARPDRDVIADEMYRLVGADVGPEEEMAPDDRNSWVAACALRWGFRGEEASAVLRYLGGGFGETDDAVAPLGDAHASAVVALHDELFPGTHTPGRMLVESTQPRLVYLEAGDVVGYVAAEIQSDRSGYIDYLGVRLDQRGRGVGRALVRAATNRLLGLEATSVNLTVRESNAVARALYGSLGFNEERVIRPYRKGFSLGG